MHIYLVLQCCTVQGYVYDIPALRFFNQQFLESTLSLTHVYKVFSFKNTAAFIQLFYYYYLSFQFSARIFSGRNNNFQKNEPETGIPVFLRHRNYRQEAGIFVIFFGGNFSGYFFPTAIHFWRFFSGGNFGYITTRRKFFSKPEENVIGYHSSLPFSISKLRQYFRIQFLTFFIFMLFYK